MKRIFSFISFYIYVCFIAWEYETEEVTVFVNLGNKSTILLPEFESNRN